MRSHKQGVRRLAGRVNFKPIDLDGEKLKEPPVRLYL